MDFQQITSLMKSNMEALNDLLTKRLSSNVALIDQISGYIIHSGGKRIRPLIVLMLCSAMSYQKDDKYTMAAVIELIHTATLLHDDVVDESSMRRGNDTANENWGNAAAVLTGDFLYSRAFELMVEPNSMTIMQIMSSATNRIAEGEVMQLLNCGRIDLTEAEYFATIEKKTAVLFEAASHCTGVLSGKTDKEMLKNLSNFGTNLGNAFQIIDDILDYKADSSALGKEMGDDLAEGKITLPVLYALQHCNTSDTEFLTTTIEQKDIKNIEKFIQIVNDCGGFKYAQEKAQECANNAKKDIDFLAESEYKTALISLCDLSLDRKS